MLFVRLTPVPVTVMMLNDRAKQANYEEIRQQREARVASVGPWNGGEISPEGTGKRGARISNR